MKLILIAISFIFLMTFSGCGYKQSVLTEGQKSSLYFSGDVNNVQVSVDNGALFEVQSGKNNQYKIKPGKHEIKVYRDNNLVIHRNIYVGDGIAKEIEIQ